MREIGRGISETKNRVEKLVGIPLLLRVDSGRGRTALYHAKVIKAFPSIFTVELENGEIKAFSYNDVHTKGIMFLKEDN